MLRNGHGGLGRVSPSSTERAVGPTCAQEAWDIDRQTGLAQPAGSFDTAWLVPASLHFPWPRTTEVVAVDFPGPQGYDPLGSLPSSRHLFRSRWSSLARAR
jgi:hypothetical protein